MNSQERFTQICTFLDQQDWKYQPDSDQQRLRLMVENEVVIIAVEENGEFIKFLLPQLLTVPADHPHYETALETLLHLGWKYKLARWQRDSDDGEVRVQADLPIEDSELTAKQFWRTLQGTVQIAQTGQERVQTVLATGKDSGKTAPKSASFGGRDPENNQQLAFLQMLFDKILEHQGNPQQIYPIFQANLNYFNLALIPTLNQFWQILQVNQEQKQLIPAVFGEFGNLIQQFPLGNQSFNIQIAIACYEAALTVWKPDTAPLDWATTQNNLGNAYSDLPTGDRAANLKQAIDCYEAALTVWKPDTAPLDWATTQNNLGSAYLNLPTGDRGANLQQAKEIFRQAKQAKSAKERMRLRREGLRKMAAAPEKCFWSGMAPKYRHDPLYIEAAQNAWVDITCKIYGTSQRADIYDPDKGDASPITLWNNRCKWAYLDLCKGKQKEQIWIKPIDSGTEDSPTIDDIPASEDEQPLLKLMRQERLDLIPKIREIIQQDAEGKYRNTFVRQKPPPPITAQEVMLEICDRTSRGEKWTNKILAEHFKIKTGTMNSAWSRTLLPLLREIGDRLKNDLKN